MNTITTKDGTQSTTRTGARASPVVFSHGWPLSSDSWESQMLFLASKGYRCIAHDCRGHGRSSQPWNGNEMNTYADDLATLLDTLDLKHAGLIGFSAGGGEVARLHRPPRHEASGQGCAGCGRPAADAEDRRQSGGLPVKVFDDIRAGSIADRSKLYQELASGPFFGFNRPARRFHRV